MGKNIFVKPRVNKSNNQITTNFNRKDLPKEFLKDLSKFNVKRMKIKLEEWD